MDLELGGKRAVITGGSGGIGLAVAQALAGEGAHVALVARHRKGLDRAIALLDASRGRTFALVADTSDDQSVRAMVQKADRDMGGVDILVNARVG